MHPVGSYFTDISQCTVDKTLKLFYLKRCLVSTPQRDVFDVGNAGGTLGYIGCIKILSLELDINSATCDKAQCYAEATTCTLRFN
jgi:hypothetical protein